MSEVEAEATVVDGERAGHEPAAATARVDVDAHPSASALVVPAPGSPDQVPVVSLADHSDDARSAAIRASLTPEFSEPDANAEPPAEFVPATFVPAEIVPAEPRPDPSIFTEPETEPSEEEPSSDDDSMPGGDSIPDDYDEPGDDSSPDDDGEPARTDDAVASAIEDDGFPPPPPKPSGPKLTPISQLQTRQAAVQRGRASVAPAPFRTDEEMARAEAAMPSPVSAPPSVGYVSPAPTAAPITSEPDAAAPNRTSASTRPASSSATTPGRSAAIASADYVPTAPAVSAASAAVPTDGHAAVSTTPEAAEKPKPTLKPMGAAGVSARARVTAPDPNTVPLDPTPEEQATAADADRAAAEQAAHAAAFHAAQTARAQQAAHEQAVRDQAARDQAAHEQFRREQAARDQAAREQFHREQAARDQAARDQAARDQAAHEQFRREQAARDQAARDQAAHEQFRREQAARDQAARDQAAHEQFRREQAARDQAARDQAARDQAARDQFRRDHAARDHAARADAADTGQIPAVRLTQSPAHPPYAPAAGKGAAPWSPSVADQVVAVPEPKQRRAAQLALIAGIVVVALLGGGFVGLKVLRGGPKPDMARVPVFGTPGAVLAAPAIDAPIPTPAGMTAAVRSALRDSRLGTHVSFQVSDLATGKVLFSQNRFSPTTPASTMKVATAAALLNLRGSNYRFTTKVVAGPHPGEVVLVGGGDPTLTAGTSSPNYPGAARLSDLANQVKRALGDVQPTKVIVDASLFSGPVTGPGWDKSDAHSKYATSIYALTTDAGREDPSGEGDTARYDNTPQAAGEIFAKQLGVPTASVSAGQAAPGAQQLGAVQSAPLLRILDGMLVTSDNVVAEFMARQVAIALHQPASFSGAAAAMTAALTKMGIPMQGVDIVDGSGLSPQNKLTPGMLGGLLQHAGSPANPNLHGLFSGLPVAGWSGTLAGRFKTKATAGARGVFRAKTGTLNNVHALAGTVVDADGRPLVFVLLLDKVAPDADYGAAMDKLGAAVAACGCAS